MYACSDAFHTAVANGNEQKALLIFSDCVFTDDDISVENGIEFQDYFNAETDLSIGQALSNEISFTLFNDDRLLNNYEFGDFIATIGVHIETTTYQQFYPVSVVTITGNQKNTWSGENEYPFVRRNGQPVQAQPSFPVKALLAYDNKVWAFGINGQYAVYNDATGANITQSNPVNSFMRAKAKKYWQSKGIFYNKNNRMLYIYEKGDCKRYEFVPLGKFVAERPNAPDMIQIRMTCHDQMEKFEKDMPSAGELGISYPTTISNLYVNMCNKVGVPYATSTFINSSAVISSEPDDFESTTMREVIKWIAEASGSNARFNRDGVLELAWLKTTSQTYTARNYREFNPYWYTTKKVTGIQNRDTQESTDIVYGSGSEKYLIQDNPLLRGVN